MLATPWGAVRRRIRVALGEGAITPVEVRGADFWVDTERRPKVAVVRLDCAAASPARLTDSPTHPVHQAVHLTVFTESGERIGAHALRA
jgi:hypothetical protein